MMKSKKTKIIFVLLLVLLGLFVYYFFYFTRPNGNEEKTLVVGGQSFKVEVVSSGDDLQKGLSGRESLCSDCGMLFEFPNPGRYSFWMKNMKFGLDILWIKDKKIVHAERSISEKSPDIITPSVDADSVLELPAGTLERLGVMENEKINF